VGTVRTTLVDKICFYFANLEYPPVALLVRGYGSVPLLAHLFKCGNLEPPPANCYLQAIYNVVCPYRVDYMSFQFNKVYIEYFKWQD
jgi:hypothetical protein